VEDRLYAALLRMVAQHCWLSTRFRSQEGATLDSYAISANAEAMGLLADAGYLAIQSEFGGRIIATISPKGVALLDREDGAA